MMPVDKNPSVSQIRAFGLTMLAGFTVTGAALWYLGVLPETGWHPESGWGWRGGGRQAAAVVLWGIGIAWAAVCVVSCSWGRCLYVLWMVPAAYLGHAMTIILLSVMFFLCLPVFALIRWKDPLRFRLGQTLSYWEEHKPHEATLERAKRPF